MDRVLYLRGVVVITSMHDEIGIRIDRVDGGETTIKFRTVDSAHGVESPTSINRKEWEEFRGTVERMLDHLDKRC